MDIMIIELGLSYGKNPSKRKINGFGNIFLFGVRVVGGFGLFVDGQTIDVNPAIRTYRAGILAGTTTDAQFAIDRRDNEMTCRVVRRIQHHFDRLGRAVFVAGCTILAQRMDDAIFPHENSLPDAGELLLFQGQRLQGMCRADGGANRAVVIAEAVFETENRLHETAQAQLEGRGRDDPGRAFAHAKMAAGAIAFEMLDALRSRRKKRQRFLVGDVAFPFRCVGVGRCGHAPRFFRKDSRNRRNEQREHRPV